MALFRIYIDKKINAKGEGGDHSRVFDIDVPDEAAAFDALKLEKDEEVNQIVSLYVGGQAPSLSGESLVDFYIARLQELGIEVPRMEKV